MKKLWIFLFVILIAGFAFQGCKSKQQEAREDAVEAREDAREENNTASQEAREDTKEFKEDAEQLAHETKKDTLDAGDDAADAANNTGSELKEGAKEVGSELKDAGITTAVKSKFAVDDVVKATNIDVDTENGVVTLTGTVSTTKESIRAVSIAESVDGVKSVQNHLKVSGS